MHLAGRARVHERRLRAVPHRRRLHRGGEHLFRLTPFGSILRGKESSGAVMRGRNPVTQGTLQEEGSALTFQLIKVHKISGDGRGKLLEIVESGSGQNPSPSVMLVSSRSEFIVQPTIPTRMKQFLETRPVILLK